MIKQDEAPLRWVGKIHDRLDRLLYGFSTFALPLIILLLSGVALLSWKSQYPTPDTLVLPLRVLAQSDESWTAAQARSKLDTQKPVPYFDTQLSEKPFWFSFTVPEAGGQDSRSIEFSSRHAMDTTCWEAGSGRALGAATRAAGLPGRWRQSRPASP